MLQELAEQEVDYVCTKNDGERAIEEAPETTECRYAREGCIIHGLLNQLHHRRGSIY